MARKKFEYNNFYHIYNRGVEKRNIFMDDEDRSMFMHHLFALNNKKSLTNLPKNRKQEIDREPLVKIHAFCLMDNHYHLLLQEITEDGISKFMQKIGTGYTMFFNKKYQRTGALFQGKFKYKHIATDGHMNYILDYIHLNPNYEGPTFVIDKLTDYKWSSLPIYLDTPMMDFSPVIETDFFLDFLGGKKSLLRRLTSSAKYQSDQVKNNAEILIDYLE